MTIQHQRTDLKSIQRIVIKLGTRVLTDADDGIEAKLKRLARTVDRLAQQHRQVLLVSSGAVGLGSRLLGLDQIPDELQERQACAAIGQTRLMSLYQKAFAGKSRQCAQVLLTQSDFEHRISYLNLRGTLTTLLRHDVTPVINENDVVSTEELAYLENENQKVFGDNDKLSALVAAKLDAGLLVLLTDVAGVYDRDPHSNGDASLISEYNQPDSVDTRSSRIGPGRGGMQRKIEAAQIAARAGCHAVIASGHDAKALDRVLDGLDEGTWFAPKHKLTARRRWIAFAVAPRGLLKLDEGCVRAVCESGASVLAAGVLSCEGDFRKGDVVELANASGHVIGRGMVFCDHDVARNWAAGRKPVGVRNHHALVHRDHLVLD